jgi:molybdopterin converting factor small subunit
VKIRVQLFALARELCGGAAAIEVEVPAGARVADLKRSLAGAYPSLSPYLPHFNFSVNAEYVSVETLLCEGDALACIPPVSGG